MKDTLKSWLHCFKIEQRFIDIEDDQGKCGHERMKAKIKAHAVDHTPMVTAPTVVVDIIRDAISSLAGN